MHFLDLKCLIHVKIKHRSLLLKFPLLKKWHFLDLVCSIHVVTIKIEFSYSNSSLLQKWHILDLICAICAVTMRTEVYFIKYPLLKKWHFLDLVCAYEFEFCSKIRMHPAQHCFARPGGVHNNIYLCKNQFKGSWTHCIPYKETITKILPTNMTSNQAALTWRILV